AMTLPHLGPYRVEAFNASKESENKIHDDAVARRFGFKGGLVPGVDVYAYMTHLPVTRWGRGWLERRSEERRGGKRGGTRGQHTRLVSDWSSDVWSSDLAMTLPHLGPYRVEAFNASKESENKIHDDAVARRFGFKGGLVPGVDVYAYMTHLPVTRWGRGWLER